LLRTKQKPTTGGADSGFLETLLGLKLALSLRLWSHYKWTSTKGSTRARLWRATTDAIAIAYRAVHKLLEIQRQVYTYTLGR